MSHSDISSAVPGSGPTVAEIVAAIPRPQLDPAEAVDLGRRTYAALAAGASLTDISIDQFATRGMLADALLAYVVAEADAGRLTGRAVA